MRDFPPPVSAYTGDAPQRPDARSPRHLLWWLVRQQGDLLAAASVFSVLWMLPTALTPWVFGQAVDEGIDTGDAGQVVGWLGVLLLITVLGASSGIFYHTVVVRSWLVALYGTTSHVTHQSVALGHVLPRRSPTGEVLSVSGSDGDQFGGFMEILSRAIGNLVAYAVVALIVLSVSVELGLVVLLVAPLLVLTSAPLLRPMGRAQTQERSRDSELTSLATDIVAGLRILRGIGGERVFGDNYASQSQRVRVAGVRAGLWQAIVEAVGVLFSGLFVVALMWLGVRELAQGRLTIGELIAFLGYALFLVQPIRVFFEFAQKVTRARVSARKAIAVLGQPDPWPSARHTKAAPAQGSTTASAPAQGSAPARGAPTSAAPALSGNAELYDAASGLRVAPGVLTMVVSAVPDESAALADRLGRYL
ncbi:MAG: ABC transporter ATP-binding protein, partial [Actinobacteria bacterium]|nr:ABC transporter ATP-binding protein [Actinomycetota bacterium]